MTTPTREREFRTNAAGAALLPARGTARIANAVAAETLVTRREARDRVDALPVGGVATFPRRNGDRVFVERIR